jgi:hypothetical protein
VTDPQSLSHEELVAEVRYLRYTLWLVSLRDLRSQAPTKYPFPREYHTKEQIQPPQIAKALSKLEKSSDCQNQA